MADSKSGSIITKIETCQGRVAFAAEGAVLFVGVGDQPAKLWPVTGGKLIAALSVSEGHASTAMAVSDDGEFVALGDDDSGVRVWKARTGQGVSEFLRIPHGRNGKEIHAIDFDPSGKMLAIGGTDCRVRLYEIGSNKPPRELSHCDADVFHDMEIGCVKFSPDGTRLVSTSWPWWEARVWDVASGKLIDSIGCEGGNPFPMPAWFTPDSKRVTIALGGQSYAIGETRDDANRSINGGSPWCCSDGVLVWTQTANTLTIRRLSDGAQIWSLHVQQN